MNCPFCVKSDQSTWCEILLEKATPDRASLSLSQCACRINNPEDCPEFTKALEQFASTPKVVSDRRPQTPAWRIGHINRLGGVRTLEPDLQ